MRLKIFRLVRIFDLMLTTGTGLSLYTNELDV